MFDYEFNIKMKSSSAPVLECGPPLQHVNHLLRVLWERIQISPENVPGYMVTEVIEKMVRINYIRIEDFVQKLYSRKESFGTLEDVLHFQR
jgi:hypothetical protein